MQQSMATGQPLSCPVCGAAPADRLFYSSPDWVVPQCSDCTYAWVEDISPRPASTSFDWDEEVFLESMRRTPLYRDRIRRLEVHNPQPRRWFDVGCGGGGLLKCAREAGFSVEGLELSPSGARVARELNITIHNRPLDECLSEVRGGPFGVISYCHVLEHVIDPLHELNTAAQLLAPDGLLLVEVPHFGSLSWKVAGNRHRHFYRGHRSYFNERSLSTLLRKAKFDIVTMQTRVPHYTTIDWLLAKVPALHPVRSSARALHLDQVAVRADLGDMFLVIARRSGVASTNG